MRTGRPFRDPKGTRRRRRARLDDVQTVFRRFHHFRGVGAGVEPEFVAAAGGDVRENAQAVGAGR
jgi:hypothetical protein